MSARPTCPVCRKPTDGTVITLHDNGRALAIRLADDKLADLEAKASENADHFQDGGGNNFEMDVITTVQDVRATLARIIRESA